MVDEKIVDVKEEKLNVKADRVIVCAGAYQAIEQAFNSVDRKGAILLFAIPDKDIQVPTAVFWRNEITLASSYGAAPRDLKEALDLIKSKKIDAKGMITHKLPLDEIQKGFKILSDAQESLKVVLLP